MHGTLSRTEEERQTRIALNTARLMVARSKLDFYSYRLTTTPWMIDCWWQRHSAEHLMQWWRDFRAGKRPKLVLEAPPQHGKSEQIRDFISWTAGRDPSLRTIFASYSNELGATTNISVQRKMSSPSYRCIFPSTKMSEGKLSISEGHFRRTTGIIEYVGARGSFRNTTVEGQINGQGLDIGIIDDPIKGRAEAQYKSTRDRTWGWFTDDFFARFSKEAGMIAIMTRWHVDDPIGRWLERFPETKVLKYQAIAEPDDWSVQEGYRKAGEALFLEHKPLDFLLERKQAMTEGSWQSEYQQNPITIGGGIFPIDKLRTVPTWDRSGIKKSVRYWDKAGTADGDGAYTSGVLMHAMRDGRFVVEHVVRGRWSALDREQNIRMWADKDSSALRTPYEVGVEQEPGSGGKESAESTVRGLAGYRCFVDKVTGKKEVRAEPFAAQVQGGNVWLVAGAWHYAYLDELESFPNGKYKDQADASSGSFNRLASKPAYNLDAMQ